ncbi:hypothetical protein CDL15_Pgr020652 [Punica granatum]|uniref:Uncharacterized protein n=1 Tax=Punica granatum TaxID=22663 RepID=A0A218W5A4_PUNGR|nr:hypothetical protein CDL15_Pgr020652 [Punica granatum]
MTRSVPTSLAGVTHYGDLGVNFNQGSPSVRRLPRLCWHELQPGMPQCTSLAEVVLVRTSTGDALVYVAWKCLSWVDDVRGGLGASVERECPSLYRRCDSWWAVCATVAPDRLMSSMGYLHAEPLPYQSIREEAREEFSERREPVHHSLPVTGMSL